MKKEFISVIFLFVLSLANAQDTKNDSTKGKWELGIIGGPNDVFIYGASPIINVEPAYYYLLGAAGQYNFSDIFSIKSEISFERKGFAQDFSFVTNPASPNPFITTTNPTNLDYITLPIMAKVSLGKKVKFFINAGLYFGYMVNATSKITYVDSSGNEHSTTNNVVKNYKHFDFGGGGGFGIEIPIKNKLILSLEGRLFYGFLDNGYIFTSNSTTKNESADLLLGLRYKL